MAVRALLLLLLAIFVSASQASAALVDIYVSRIAATQDWQLRVDSLGPPVGALVLVVSDSLESFTPDPSLPPIICYGSCAVPPPDGSGLHAFAIFDPTGSPPPYVPLVTAGNSRVLGVFHSSSNDVPQVLPGDGVAGATVFEVDGDAVTDFAIHVVPEPGVTGLALLAFLGLTGLAARAR